MHGRVGLDHCIVPRCVDQREEIDVSDDEMVRVRLVGGPMDGGHLPVDWHVVHDPDPGFDFVPADGSGAPEMEDGTPCTRVLYTAEPGGDPAVWHWRGWVP